jgi:molybdate transport system substrate-binding protein
MKRRPVGRALGLMAALALGGCLLAGCGGNRTDSGGTRQVRVAAAANLKFAFDDVVGAFREKHPDISVAATYGSSGNFFAQLTNQAPFDLFLSADVEYPRKLFAQGKAAQGTEFVYALGQLAVWVPSDSKLDLDTLGIRAAVDPSVRKVAIANPRHAPYGRAAEAALRKLSVYDAVKDRLVLGENIEQAALFVESGAADLGVIALSLALSPALRGKGKYWVIPRDAYPALEQGGIILAWAQDREAADTLRHFLVGKGGREVFRRHGYELPAEPLGAATPTPRGSAPQDQ